MTYLRAAKYLSPESFLNFSEIVIPKIDASNHSTLKDSFERISTEALDKNAHERSKNLMKGIKKNIRDSIVFAETGMNANFFAGDLSMNSKVDFS